MDITPYFGIITEEHALVTKTPFTNGVLLANFKERQVLKLVSRDTVRLTDVDYYETIEDFVDNLTSYDIGLYFLEEGTHDISRCLRRKGIFVPFSDITWEKKDTPQSYCDKVKAYIKENFSVFAKGLLDLLNTIETSNPRVVFKRHGVDLSLDCIVHDFYERTKDTIFVTMINGTSRYKDLEAISDTNLYYHTKEIIETRESSSVLFLVNLGIDTTILYSWNGYQVKDLATIISTTDNIRVISDNPDYASITEWKDMNYMLNLLKPFNHKAEEISDIITDMSTFRKVDNKYVAMFINKASVDKDDRVLTVSIEVDENSCIFISVKSDSVYYEDWEHIDDMTLNFANINLNIVIKNIINIFKDYNGILPSKEYIVNQFTYRNILGKTI